MTSYVLGIDGGGTKTQAVILNQDGVLCGVGMGGPANFDDIGVDAVRENLHRAVQQARQQAGLDDSPFAAAFLGIAGVVSRTDHAIVSELAASLQLAPPAQVGIDHDCRIALAGGLSGRPGIVLIAGTGSSCFGVNAQGERWLVGGWGYIMGDDGSSYWLGCQALRAAVAAYDTRSPETLIRPRLMQALGISDMNDILHRVYVEGMSRTQIAALAPIVTQAAREGDAVAIEMIERGASLLAYWIQTVKNKLAMPNATEVTLVGGLMRAGSIVQDTLSQAIQQCCPDCIITPPALPSNLGAGVLALQSLGLDVGHDTRARNLQSAAQALMG
ncbi:MAG: hypothetical protein JNJ61_22515 [Anaerolineae bacterium]|nr:hypothetical protein [Anaerolineae bacterium]